MTDLMCADRRRKETPHERLDRNFGELLQEVRVAQTGVQILFAFLLTLPFAARFTVTLPRDRVVYAITLAACAMAVMVLTAPVIYHRLVFRQDRKAELVAVTSVLAIVGTGFLLAAIVGGVFLVIDVVAGLVAGAVMAGAVAVVGISVWYVAPLYRGRHAAIGQTNGERAGQLDRSPVAQAPSQGIGPFSPRPEQTSPRSEPGP
jgi:hypothetical protein